MVVILGFLYSNPYFSYKSLDNYPHDDEWNPYQTHNIELGMSGSVARNCDHQTTEAVGRQSSGMEISGKIVEGIWRTAGKE
jgi:hypothetical protein